MVKPNLGRSRLLVAALCGLLLSWGCSSSERKKPGVGDDAGALDAAVTPGSVGDGGSAGTGGGGGGTSVGGASGGRGGSGGGGNGASSGGSGGATDAASPPDAGSSTDAPVRGDGSDADGAVEAGSPDAANGPDTGAFASVMSFFVTSRGLGSGGNLGGLAGADAHCLALAKAVGSTKTKWAAYLSIFGAGTPIHARDRIGTGPWYNARGVKIAEDLEDLHADAGMRNRIALDTALDENGNVVPGRDEATRPPGTVSEHDILTGSTIAGMVYEGRTCADWSSDSTGVIAQVGHSDKMGPMDRIQWNSAHETSGCAEGRASGGVASGGGRGSFYCFAAD